MAGPVAANPTAADLELVRVSIREEGAFGVLLALKVPPGQDGIPIGTSVERTYPLEDSHRGQFIKIPAGRHLCTRSMFYHGRPRPYETFEIHVQGFSRLLFHRANVEDDLEGCIGVGRRFGLLHGKPAVLESTEGFADFMAWAGRRDRFELLVRHTT